MSELACVNVACAKLLCVMMKCVSRYGCMWVCVYMCGIGCMLCIHVCRIGYGYVYVGLVVRGCGIVVCVCVCGISHACARMCSRVWHCCTCVALFCMHACVGFLYMYTGLFYLHVCGGLVVPTCLWGCGTCTVRVCGVSGTCTRVWG